MQSPILIIKLGAAGDVLRTTSLLQGLKEAYPEHPIWWVTYSPAIALLDNNPLIDKATGLLPHDREVLEKTSFFKIIILEEDEAVCEFATKLKGEKIGFIWNGEKVVPTPSALEWYMMSALGPQPKNDELKKTNKETWQRILQRIVGIHPKRYDTLLFLTEEEKSFGKEFSNKNKIQKDDFVIGINTGAGGRWPLKSLSERKTVKLIERIKNEISINKKIKIVLLGGPEELTRNRIILIELRGVVDEIIDSGCNSLKEFASIINICDVVVTSDSLAMHIAIALKKKIVAFFTCTSSAEIELYGLGEKVIPRGGCICCYKKYPPEKPSCNDELYVEDIFDAVKKVIQ